jgi:hypothetical protein
MNYVISCDHIESSFNSSTDEIYLDPALFTIITHKVIRAQYRNCRNPVSARHCFFKSRVPCSAVTTSFGTIAKSGDLDLHSFLLPRILFQILLEKNNSLSSDVDEETANIGKKRTILLTGKFHRARRKYLRHSSPRFPPEFVHCVLHCIMEIRHLPSPK